MRVVLAEVASELLAQTRAIAPVRLLGIPADPARARAAGRSGVPAVSDIGQEFDIRSGAKGKSQKFTGEDCFCERIRRVSAIEEASAPHSW